MLGVMMPFWCYLE